MVGEEIERRRARLLALLARLAASVALATGTLAQDGTLQDVRDAARDGDDADAFDPDCEEPEEGDFFDQLEASVSDDLFDRTFGVVIEAIVYLPVLLPRALAHDPGGEPAGFDRYPYREGDRYWVPADVEPRERRGSAAIGRFELGTDFDDLERVGFALLWEHESRFGIDASWSRWREDLDGGGTDELDLGDLDLVYRFAHGERAAFRAGVGVNYLDDRIDEELGFNFTYGADFLPVRPLVASLEMNHGTLGDAGLQHYRASLGVIIEHFELTAGADYWEIDDEDLRSYSIGLRGWF